MRTVRSSLEAEKNKKSNILSFAYRFRTCTTSTGNTTSLFAVTSFLIKPKKSHRPLLTSTVFDLFARLVLQACDCIEHKNQIEPAGNRNIKNVCQFFLSPFQRVSSLFCFLLTRAVLTRSVLTRSVKRSVTQTSQKH